MALAPRLVEPFDPLPGDPPPDRGVVVIDAALLADLVSRANPGHDVSVHWGEPYGSSVDGRPIYEPVFTKHWPEAAS